MKGVVVLAALLQLAATVDLNPTCNQICPMIYSPVCGSDGRTYGNSCVLTARNCNSLEKVSIAHAGTCVEEIAEHSKRAFINCYECNSGVVLDNPNCPANGTTHDGHTEHRSCASKCFVRDNEYYPDAVMYYTCRKCYLYQISSGTVGCFKVVFRGCIADYPDLAEPIPEDGYHGYHHGQIFICSTDICNGKPFSEILLHPPDTPPDNIGIE